MNQSTYLVCTYIYISIADISFMFIFIRAPLRTINRRGIESTSTKRDVAAFACYLPLFREIIVPLRSQKAQDRERATRMVLSARSLARRASELFIALNHRSASPR